MATRRKKGAPYHYTECGLDYIYLVNGFKYVETPRGKGVVIEDVEGLHRAIGMVLVEERKDLTGEEFRFLRHELNMTQLHLASVIGVDVQSVARWEKGHVKGPIDRPAQHLLRLLYREYLDGNPKIKESLRVLAELDERIHQHTERLSFNEAKREWETAPLAA
jgi:DNA-binding transcriptional regulator YiaG